MVAYLRNLQGLLLQLDGAYPELELRPGETPEEAARRLAAELGLEAGRCFWRGEEGIGLEVSGEPLRGEFVKWSPFDPRQLELHRVWSALPPSFIVTPEWASLTGGFFYADPAREPNDVDVVVRGSGLPTGARLKLERALSAASGKPVHVTPEPTGPSWSYLPIYDLVAVKRPFQLVNLDEPEFAAQFYKAAIELGKPFDQYAAAGEFYSGDEEFIWERWARRAAERGTPILVQQKYDGFRMIIHRIGEKLHVFSDQGLDRAAIFPGLGEALPLGRYIIDTEFMQLKEPGGPPRERWEMAWMGSAKEAPRPFPPIRIAVHDLVWWDRDLSQEPYSHRLELLRRHFRPGRHGPFELELAPTKEAADEESLREAIAWAASQPGSEGAMLKFADFRYAPKVLAEVAKYKKAIEIDAVIIGWRKMPPSRPAGVRWTREEAFRALRQGNTRTYIFRVAIADGDQLIPLESDGRLTPGDLQLDWDEERQTWTGTDDPKLWRMCPRFPARGPGEYKYANTYAIALEEEPECGQIVTVAPVKFRPFRKEDGSWGYAWMFPRVKNLKPKGSPPAQLKSVLRAFGLPLEKEVKPAGPADATLAIVGDGPGRVEEETGKPFSGPSGQLLRETLEEIGIQPETVYLTNVYRERQEKVEASSFAERAEALREELGRLKALKAIVALSEIAAAALTGRREPIRELRLGEHRLDGIPVIVTYHPAALLRTGGKKSRLYPEFRRDLERAKRLLEKASIAHSIAFYPDEEKVWRFVLQIHFRGRTAHGDLRLQLTREILEGWTISLQQPDAIREPIDTLPKAKQALREGELWKLDWKTGKILPRRVRTTIQGKPREIVRPGALLAFPKKAEIASSWLEIEGVTDRPDPGERPPVGATRNYPGVFLIADRGIVHFGARRPWFFEYFLNGRLLRGRYLLRAVGRLEKELPPSEPEEGRQPFYWIFLKPTDETPYVLSQEAVEKRWLPPQGVSALPPEWREKIPRRLRYWEVSGEEALERRRQLVEEFEELIGTTVKRG